ncbi:MAG: threonine dehydratase [Dongiaceae bacterium]
MFALELRNLIDTMRAQVFTPVGEARLLPTLAQLEAAAALVHAGMPPTPQYCWPLLCQRAGAEVWVKHENHTPVGAFKVRGGLVYMRELKRQQPDIAGVIAATRGNHGQSVAFAARRAGLPAVIVVPHGNSVEKNAAMRALGAELIEHGHDFQAAYEYAMGLAAARKLHALRSFHPWLVTGVGSYALELFRAVPAIDTVYVPIGLGSGICGTIAARDALGLTTKVVGVVAENAPAYALSLAKKSAVSTNSADTIADGMACRVPDNDALGIIFKGADRIVTVSEDEIKAAMGHYFRDTHNVAEGAGAAPLAALIKERERMIGKRAGLILSGGNVDRIVFARVPLETSNHPA